MQKSITEIDARTILKNIERSDRAKAILSKRTSVIPVVLVSSLGGAVCATAIASSKFEAPLMVIVLLVLGSVGAIVGAMENYTIRRRLEAEIELLQLQEELRSSNN